jgi:hypothetical protein
MRENKPLYKNNQLKETRDLREYKKMKLAHQSIPIQDYKYPKHNDFLVNPANIQVAYTYKNEILMKDRISSYKKPTSMKTSNFSYNA